jgi:hypothetical protein
MCEFCELRVAGIPRDGDHVFFVVQPSQAVVNASLHASFKRTRSSSRTCYAERWPSPTSRTNRKQLIKRHRVIDDD